MEGTILRKTRLWEILIKNDTIIVEHDPIVEIATIARMYFFSNDIQEENTTLIRYLLAVLCQIILPYNILLLPVQASKRTPPKMR